MIFFAKYLYLLIILIGIIYLLKQDRKKQKEILLFTLISLPIIFIIGQIAGILFYNPRPFVVRHFTPLIPHAANNGFPSNHALISFAISAILFIFNRRLGILVAIFALLVGIGRIYVGIHSPIDILGSFLISVIVEAIVYLLFPKVWLKQTIHQ